MCSVLRMTATGASIAKRKQNKNQMILKRPGFHLQCSPGRFTKHAEYLHVRRNHVHVCIEEVENVSEWINLKNLF